MWPGKALRASDDSDRQRASINRAFIGKVFAGRHPYLRPAGFSRLPAGRLEAPLVSDGPWFLIKESANPEKNARLHLELQILPLIL